MVPTQQVMATHNLLSLPIFLQFDFVSESIPFLMEALMFFLCVLGSWGIQVSKQGGVGGSWFIIHISKTWKAKNTPFLTVSIKNIHYAKLLRFPGLKEQIIFMVT